MTPMVTDEAPVTTETPPETNPEAALDETAAAEAPTAGADDAPAPEATPPVPSNKHWYVVKVQSGREETIKEAIERKVKIEGLEECYGQIYIPTEQVTEMRKGKRYTRQKKSLPGYIMA